MTSRIVASALVLGGLGVGLLIAELAARAVYVEPWWDALLREQLEAEQRTYERREDGLRDREYPSPKPEGRLRVLLLGDSFTFGIGVSDEEAIFPAILERELDREAAALDAGGVDVLNAGIPASLTSTWVRVAEREGESFQPDVVIAVFFLRDGTTLRAKEDFFEPLRDELAGRNEGSRLYRASALWRVVRDRLDRLEVSKRYTNRFVEAFLGAPSETREWSKAQGNLRRIRDSCRGRSAAFGLVIFPILADLRGDYPFAPIVEEVARFGRESGMPTLNLLPFFSGEHAPDLWVSPGNQHPNERGHAIVAEAMLPFVRELLER